MANYSFLALLSSQMLNSREGRILLRTSERDNRRQTASQCSAVQQILT